MVVALMQGQHLMCVTGPSTQVSLGTWARSDRVVSEWCLLRCAFLLHCPLVLSPGYSLACTHLFRHVSTLRCHTANGREVAGGHTP